MTTTTLRGTCRWLEDAPTGERRLSITVNTCRGLLTGEYTVEEVVGGYLLTYFNPSTFEIRVYRVSNREKRGNGSYYVPRDVGAWACSCPDYTNRQRPCKHILALRASLARLPF